MWRYTAVNRSNIVCHISRKWEMVKKWRENYHNMPYFAVNELATSSNTVLFVGFVRDRERFRFRFLCPKITANQDQSKKVFTILPSTAVFFICNKFSSLNLHTHYTAQQEMLILMGEKSNEKPQAHFTKNSCMRTRTHIGSCCGVTWSILSF